MNPGDKQYAPFSLRASQPYVLTKDWNTGNWLYPCTQMVPVKPCVLPPKKCNFCHSIQKSEPRVNNGAQWTFGKDTDYNITE